MRIMRRLTSLLLAACVALTAGAALAKDKKKRDPDEIGNRDVGKGINFYSIEKETVTIHVIKIGHRKDVYALAYRISGNHEDAHDLAQDAFVRVYKGLAAFRGEASFRTWLYRIVFNLSLNHARKTRRETQGRVDIEDVALPVAPRGLDSVLEGEAKERLHGAIGKLPEKQRKTLILKVFHELKYVEIARVMSCSVGTAKANFFHAVQSLKREFERRF